jgi:hypothetical protein
VIGKGDSADTRAWTHEHAANICFSDRLFGIKHFQTVDTRLTTLATRHWFLWVRCPACRTTNAIDLRTLDRHRDVAVTSLIPALSCRSCRPNALFAELLQLSAMSVADEMRAEHTRRALGE